MNAINTPCQLRTDGLTWLDGVYEDGWLSTQARARIEGLSKIEFELFLPGRPEANRRTITARVDGKLNREMEIPRGDVTFFHVELPRSAIPRVLELTFDRPELAPQDHRELGCLCVAVRSTLAAFEEARGKLADAPAGGAPTPSLPVEFHRAAVDELMAIPPLGYLLSGWSFGRGSGVRRLVAMSSSGPMGEILEAAIRFPRPDLSQPFGAEVADQADKAGFSAFLPSPNTASRPMHLQAMYDGRHVFDVGLPEATDPSSPFDVLRSLLNFFTIGQAGMSRLLSNHIGPVISALEFGNSKNVESSAICYGVAPTSPKVSIVVPIYGRFDFIEFQLSQFALDVEVIEIADLIYVIDDPRIHQEVRRVCGHLADLYGVPFRCVFYDRNLGYAGANNVGVSYAVADHLLLLNSDVMPMEGGWLGRLLERYESAHDCGVMGVRLLYPDGSLQHDKISFMQEPYLDGLWINDHPGKGAPPPPVDALRPTVAVQAATAACVMIKTEDFRMVGGFDEGYILGDFEDSDLCLSLITNGKTNRVARDIVLVHLERQSQSLWGEQTWKQKVTIYNCWRHTNKWRDLLPVVAKRWP